MSSNGRLFDIGGATRAAIGKYIETGRAYAGSTEVNSCGNGSIMRLASIPMFYRTNVEQEKFAHLSSCVTHAHHRCTQSCKYFSTLIIRALNGLPKENVLFDEYTTKIGESVLWDISVGEYKTKTIDQIKSSVYVIDTLEAALWAFYTTNTFEEGCIKVVNLGDDSDTVGAVYGQIAGAYYGYDAIPKRWLDKIVKLDMIVDLSDKLFELNQQP